MKHPRISHYESFCGADRKGPAKPRNSCSKSRAACGRGAARMGATLSYVCMYVEPFGAWIYLYGNQARSYGACQNPWKENGDSN